LIGTVWINNRGYFKLNNTNGRLFALTALGVIIATTSGCATMFAQDHSQVNFKTEPSAGTEVYVAGKKYELDGSTIPVPKKTKSVLVSNPDYGDFIVPLNRHVNGGWVALDIFFTPGWGILGLAIDGGSAKWYNYPSTVAIDFSNAKSAQTDRKGTVNWAIKPATPEAAEAMRKGKAPPKSK
jgi:hypothetical protein